MSVSGHIVTTSTQGVYFLPSTSALPPLWWNARRQRFVAIVHARDNAMTAAAAAAAAHARTSGDVADGSVSNDGDGNAASQATARAAAGVKAAAADAHASRALMPAACTASVRCAALYGVLPVGADVSVLLYVTERTHVAALQLGDERTHDVYAVTRLEYMRLPSPYDDEVPGNGGESALANDDDNDDCDDDDTNNDNRTYCCTLCNDSHSDDDDDCDDDDDHHSHSKRSRHRRVCLAEGTVREYLRVVHRFCASVSSSSSSCVYYSPTVNLALCTHDLVSGAMTSSSHTTSRVAHDDDDGSDASRAVWQWNAMLLSRFALPCVHAASAAGATAAASLTRDMYVPSYMRGYVGQRTLRGACCHDDQHSSDGAAAVVSHTHTSSSSSNNNSCSSRCSSCVLSMVTRLSCRWAGTRYHRRGLEPDGSGVTANLAMTTMWLHCNTRAQGDSSNSNKCGNNSYGSSNSSSECNEKDATGQTCVRRVAVCEMVRGSVPLRWQQPADLSLKPPIRILTAVNGRHDRPGRHKGSDSGSDGTAAAVAQQRRASEVGTASAAAAAAANDLCTHIRLLQALLSPLRVRVLCLLDTTSRRSRLERPLSEHYDDVVAYASSQQQEQEVQVQTAEQQQQQQRRLPTLVYVHHDLGSDVHHRHCASTRRRVCAAVRDALRPCMTTSPPPSPIASSLFTAYEQRHGGGGGGGVDDVHTDSSHMTTTAAATAAAVVVHAVQTVCVRVNCLDCLDRTNLAQCLLMQPLLQHMLAYVCTGTLEQHQHTTDVLQPLRQRPQPSSPSSSSSHNNNDHDDVVHALRHGVHCAAQELFAQQGRALSYLYAHSPPHLLAYMCDDDDDDDDDDCCDGAAGHSHNSRNNNNDDDGAADVAAVMATRGALQPLRTSRARRTWRVRWQLYAGGAVIALRRWYQQNFRDGAKQDAVSLLTRQHEPVLFCSNAAAAVAVATSAATRATTTTTTTTTAVTAAVATPFARDLTSMNRLMHYGVLLPLVPLLVSVVLALCAHDTATARLHLVLAMAWAVYVCVVAYRLRRYRVTYTNRSLLSYGHR